MVENENLTMYCKTYTPLIDWHDKKGVPEGSADSGWILLDYGEVMVHIMTPKSRLFYDIEGQVRNTMCTFVIS